MELKYGKVPIVEEIGACSNRTFMELKLSSSKPARRGAVQF